jgi:phosphomannomutase
MSETIVFGTEGWRAVIAEDFTFSNVEKVVYAIGRYVQQTHQRPGEALLPVLIGYDTRFLADEFARRAAQVLLSMGIPAKISERDVPTPAISYAAQAEPTLGAIQFTASHNPPKYLGVKYITPLGGPANNETTKQISAHLSDLTSNFADHNAVVPVFDPRPSYLDAILALVDVERIAAANLSIACDTMYSTSRDYLDEALRRAGVKNLKVLRNWRDPLFGGGMPEPKREYLLELIRTVSEEGFDAGLATDGDADRFGAVDEKGNHLIPNQLLCLLTRHLLKNRGMSGSIVRTVSTTHLLDSIAKMHGLSIIETPVGFKYITDMILENDVLIGGEESGGISMKGHIPEKDGILGDLLVVEMLAYEKKPLSEIWLDLLKETGREVAAKRHDLHLKLSTQRDLMEHLLYHSFDQIGGMQVTRTNKLDGLKLHIDEDTFILVRPSGTEPLIRVYVEGACPDAVGRIFDDFIGHLNARIEEIEFASPVKPAPALQP